MSKDLFEKSQKVKKSQNLIHPPITGSYGRFQKVTKKRDLGMEMWFLCYVFKYVSGGVGF